MANSQQDSETRELARWQRRLLPFAIGSIAVLAVFFFASSLWEMQRFRDMINYQPGNGLVRTLEAFERAQPQAASAAEAHEHLRWKTLVLLEAEALNHRYAQVNATLMLRAWTRHLGFLTGMVLAFVGAIFILSKLREDMTSLSAEGSGAKGALATSSPGIVLITLGSVLMVVTLTIDFEFTTTDAPVYVFRDTETVPAATALPPAPPLLDDSAARETEEQELFGKIRLEKADEE